MASILLPQTLSIYKLHVIDLAKVNYKLIAETTCDIDWNYNLQMWDVGFYGQTI